MITPRLADLSRRAKLPRMPRTRLGPRPVRSWPLGSTGPAPTPSSAPGTPRIARSTQSPSPSPPYKKPPLFASAAANLNPWTEARVDTTNPDRGPLLIIEGDKDHTVPWAVANAAYRQQQDNEGVTELAEIKNRGHSLTIDGGWREVADTALAFIQRFT